jgi:hypothetical protein
MGHSTVPRPPRQDPLASLKLPAVMTADSVKRSDNRHPAPPTCVCRDWCGCYCELQVKDKLLSVQPLFITAM